MFCPEGIFKIAQVKFGCPGAGAGGLNHLYSRAHRSGGGPLLRHKSGRMRGIPSDVSHRVTSAGVGEACRDPQHTDADGNIERVKASFYITRPLNAYFQASYLIYIMQFSHNGRAQHNHFQKEDGHFGVLFVCHSAHGR